MLRLLIADDHTLFRRGLASLLSEADEFDVVGEASDGEEAVQLAQELRPDVVLMDIHMPGGGGVQAVRQLRERLPALPIIMLTVSDADRDLLDAIRAGARGYLLKNAEPQTLFDSLRRAAAGQAVLDAALTKALFRQVAHPGTPPDAAASPLSLREAEILRLVASGCTNREIAAQLCLSENTVKTHLAHILEKLDAANRGEAVARARAQGWLEASSTLPP